MTQETSYSSESRIWDMCGLGSREGLALKTEVQLLFVRKQSQGIIYIVPVKMRAKCDSAFCDEKQIPRDISFC